MAQTLKKSTTATCTQCGKSVNPQAKFCVHCGQKLTEAIVVEAPILEPVQVKQERETYAEQIKTIFQKTVVTQEDVEILEQASLSINAKSSEARTIWEQLARHENKYCYGLAFKVLKTLLSTEEYEYFIKQLTGENALVFVPRIIDASPQVSLPCVESLWDYVQNANSLWLYLKYLDWALHCQVKLNRSIIAVLENNADEFLRSKTWKYLSRV